MATLNLGRIKPVFRGAYNSATAYVVDDIVTFGDETFICILASTGNATSNTTYWSKLASKGTDGTDVGTVITTQGDILYRDASGLQRLGAGTSGHFLKTQGTGANPVWAESGGTHVKLAGGTISSSVSQLSLDHFSNTYTHYKIVGSNFSPTGEQQFRARFRSSGTNNSDGYYKWATSHPIITSGGSSHNSHGGWDNGHFSINGTNNIGTDNTYGASFEIDIFQPYQSKKTFFHTYSIGYESGGQLNGHIGGGFFNNNNSFDGVALFFNGANIDAGDYAMYGVKY